MDGLTPMMQQYMDAKAQHPDALLLFRAGDFYETFFEDAHRAAQLLDIAVTSRSKVLGDPVPMAGVPHYAVDQYIARLIAQGVKVAICEQMEDARFAKGIVKRAVTRVVTPGVSLEDETLDARTHNFLLALARVGKRFGLAWLDASTGDFFVCEPADLEELGREISRIEPREILLPRSLAADEALRAALPPQGVLTSERDDREFEVEAGRGGLCAFFDVATLDGFGLRGVEAGVGAAGAILSYLRETRLGNLPHIGGVKLWSAAGYLVLDETTRRNLELFRSLQEGKREGTLLWLLDETRTSMGSRMLRRWMTWPLTDLEAIRARHEVVDAMLRRASLRQAVRDWLTGVADIERLNARISAATANARDLAALRRSLERLPGLAQVIREAGEPVLEPLASLDPCPDLAAELLRVLVEDPPLALKEGGLIREGVDPELDDIIVLSRDGKSALASLEARERARTGISSLKVSYNRVFGYYIEITKANLKNVPSDYHRKQTLSTGERYITPELKDYESRILGAEERRVELEYDLFLKLREVVAAQAHRLKALAQSIAELDVLTTLAEVAARGRFVRPEMTLEPVVEVKEGRHPVVEQAVARERFVPNDVSLDAASQQLLILTGPNMAGKSTVLRQVALTVLLAQMGSFVPASQARVGVADRIFTRVGASDNLARGQSTFMVEMTETAGILHHATARSLVVLDEIGRGTSTFDGVSIAWAVAEMIHDQIGCRALFATHYHELVDLALTRPRVRNYNVAVAEWGDKIVFLRRLKEGGASRSYGIQVARLAGLPRSVITRSQEILANLERGEVEEGVPRLVRRSAPPPGAQLSLFGGPPAPDPLREALKGLDVNTLTPLEALQKLSDLVSLAQPRGQGR